ncbi:hypothetical protein ACFE04_006364 [Oxalis oulophora]
MSTIILCLENVLMPEEIQSHFLVLSSLQFDKNNPSHHQKLEGELNTFVSDLNVPNADQTPPCSDTRPSNLPKHCNKTYTFKYDNVEGQWKRHLTREFEKKYERKYSLSLLPFNPLLCRFRSRRRRFTRFLYRLAKLTYSVKATFNSERKTSTTLKKDVHHTEANEVKPCLEEPLILLDNIDGIEPINIRKGFNREEIVSEVKRQMLLAGPLVTVSFLSFFLQVISVMFVGHLGELALSGASMATSFASVTGFSLLRLSDELEKLKHTASSFPEESETEEEDIVEIDDAAEEVHENEPPVIGEPLVKTTPEIPSPQKDIERQLRDQSSILHTNYDEVVFWIPIPVAPCYRGRNIDNDS